MMSLSEISYDDKFLGIIEVNNSMVQPERLPLNEHRTWGRVRERVS